MPRINPVELLTCLAVLLNPKGGIKSTLEVERIAKLMARYSKKLVSKCIYVQVLKATDPELQDLFLSAGGWSLVADWLTEGVGSMNSPLCKEVLDLLIKIPMTAQKLINEGGDAAKMAAKCSALDNQECKQLCEELMKKWGTYLSDYLNGDIDSAGRFLDYPLGGLLGPQQEPQPVETPQTEENSVEMRSETDEEIMPMLDFYPKQGNKKAKKKKKRASESEEEVKSGDAEVFKGTVPILKIVRESGKLATTLTARDRPLSTSSFEEDKQQSTDEDLPLAEVVPVKPSKKVTKKETLTVAAPDETLTKPKDKVNIENKKVEPVKKPVKDVKRRTKERLRVIFDDSDDEPSEPAESDVDSKLDENSSETAESKGVDVVVERKAEKEQKVNGQEPKTSSADGLSSSNESKQKTIVTDSKAEKPKDKQKDRPEKGDEKRSGKDKESRDREKDKRSGEKRERDRKEISSSRRDDKDRKRSEKDGDRFKSSSSRDDKNRSSSSSVSKDKSKSSIADKNRIEERSKSDAKKQAEIDQKTLESLSELARTGISMMKIPKKVKTEDDKKVEEKKSDNFSILDRKPASTVKVFNSKFRSHGCEEAPSKPPSKKPPKKDLPLFKTIPKRPLPATTDVVTPPEKKMKSPLALLEVEEGKAVRPGGIKLINPRPILQDSSIFMDALAAGHKAEKKRKRKTSESDKEQKKDETTAEVTPKPEEAEPMMSPRDEEKMEDIASPPPVKPQFKFYKDILEEDEEDSDDKPLAQLKREKEERDEREKKAVKPGETEELKQEPMEDVKAEDHKAEIKEEKVSEEEPAAGEEKPLVLDIPMADIGDLPPAPPLVFNSLVKEEVKLENVKEVSVKGRTKGVLVYHRPPNRVKKVLKWRVEEELHEYFYFELDETERVNVNRLKCQDIKQADKLIEKELAKFGNTANAVEEKKPWKLVKYDLPESTFVPGANSLEKGVQLARQAVTLETIFLSKNMIPSTPMEPDPEVPLERIETRDIPLDELEPSPEGVYDYSNTPWPEPGSEPMEHVPDPHLIQPDLPLESIEPFFIGPGPMAVPGPGPMPVLQGPGPIVGPGQFGPGPVMPMPGGPMPGMMGPRPPMTSGGTWMTGDGAVYQEAPEFGFHPTPMMPFGPGPGIFPRPQFDMPVGPMHGIRMPQNDIEFNGPPRGGHPRPPYRGDRRDHGGRGMNRDHGRDHYRRDRDDRGRDERGRDDRDRYRRDDYRRDQGRSVKQCVYFSQGRCKYEDKCAFSHGR